MIDPGRVLMTPGAIDAIARSGQKPSTFLACHVLGVWGDLDTHDRQANERALKTGDRILSSYKTSGGENIWVISEAVDLDVAGNTPDRRETTTILLPSEY